MVSPDCVAQGRLVSRSTYDEDDCGHGTPCPYKRPSSIMSFSGNSSCASGSSIRLFRRADS